MGRQITKSENWAYIAGFLDGDGSLMVQMKNRRSSRTGWRLMFTICFYQDSRHEKPLEWIRDKIGIGYISRRKDKITELRINGYEKVENVLKKIKPYAKFKAKQVDIILKILSLISGKKFPDISKAVRLKIADLVYDLRQENYFSGNRKCKSKKELRELIGF